MKNKKILILSMATLLSLGMLTGCGKKTPSTSSSSQEENITTNNPTSDNATTNPTTVTTDDGGNVEHQPPFNSTLKEGAVTRNYKADFDTMIEDFSSDTLNGTTTGTHLKKSALRVLVDSNNGDFPSNSEASIYKVATGTYEIQNYDNIGFRIRVVSGKIDYKNLVLGLRGDDDYEVFNINLDEAVDNDGEALKALDNEYQDIMISPNLSIEDADTKYMWKQGKGQGATDVKVLDKILGIHLFAKGEVSAVIEIEEIFLEVAGTKTVLDNFSRQAVNKADDTCWWRDSTGFIVTPGVNLKGGQSYITPDVEIGENTNLVLNINGDTSSTTITPITASGEGNAVSWSNLKDKENNAVANAVNGAFHPIAIDLTNSGMNLSSIKGFKISSTSEVNISSVFLTSFKEKEAVTEYPHLDTANAVVFDSFTRTQSSFNGDYDASSKDPIIMDAGLYYALSYNNGDKVKVDGDALVFTPDANTDYINFKEGSSRARTNQKYMVLPMKLEGQGDLSGLRIAGSSGEAVYTNDWYAGEGLKSIPTGKDYPYVKDGYTYYIIDLEVSNLEITDVVDIYYTGTAKLYIDSIFFADDYVELEKVVGSLENKTLNQEGYAYGGEVKTTTNTKYLSLTLKGDGVADFSAFRISHDGVDHWIKDTPWVTRSGEKITKTTLIAEEETTYVIDLEKSGFEEIKDGVINLHTGGFEDSKGIVTIEEIAVLNKTYYKNEIGEVGTVDFTDGSYQYQYGGYITGKYSKYALELKGDGKVTLQTFRMETVEDKKVVYANNGLVMTYEDGSPVDYTSPIDEKGVTIYIDLVASGFELNASNIALHFGSENVGTGVLTIRHFEADSAISYEEVLNQYVEYVAPVED